MPLKSSARNQLSGQVVSIKNGSVMSQVEIRIGENRVVAAITQESVAELQLKEGDEVVAIIKATDVMVGKSDPAGDQHVG